MEPKPAYIVDMDGLQNELRMVCSRRAREGEFVWPTPEDSLMFLATEVGEALDAHLRTEFYIRNSDKETNLAEELGDVLFMVYVSAPIFGIDLDVQVRKKLARK